MRVVFFESKLFFLRETFSESILFLLRKFFIEIKSRKENLQKLTQLSSRSHPRHLVGKRTAQKDIIIDITSHSQVNSNFPYRCFIESQFFLLAKAYYERIFFLLGVAFCDSIFFLLRKAYFLY